MKARPELEPRQWKLLDEKLAAAEQARERYEAARPAKNDQREQPSSPALGLAGMRAATEGASLMPLLVLLAALWPAETAGPGMDPPRWQEPLLDYEGKLRELSEAARQVQIEASGGRRRKSATAVPPAPHVEEAEVGEEKKGYSCTAKCQSNGSSGGAYYVYGTSPGNCREAMSNAKASVPRGEYPRHCSCSDTDGFRGAGTQCESHTR